MTRTRRLARRKGWRGGPLARTHEVRPRRDQAAGSVSARRLDAAGLAALERALTGPYGTGLCGSDARCSCASTNTLVRKETNLGDRVADDHLEPLEGSEYDAAPRSPTDFGPA